MNKDEWELLIEELKEQGLTPNQIRKMIAVYNIVKEIDENLERYFNEDSSTNPS